MQNARPTPQERIFPIVMGFWQARALAVATELGLAELLAEGPLDVEQACESKPDERLGALPPAACSGKHRIFHKLRRGSFPIPRRVTVYAKMHPVHSGPWWCMVSRKAAVRLKDGMSWNTR